MNSPILQRRASLVEQLKHNGLGAVAIVPGSNFYYFTGTNFHLMERPTLVFVSQLGEICAVMPELERLAWDVAVPEAKTFYWQDSDGYDDAIRSAMEYLGPTTIGIEGQRMRAFEMAALQKYAGADAIRDAQSIISAPRLCKDADELAFLEEAISITEKSLEETVAQISVGHTERQIRSFLFTRMIENGADDLAFDPIVLAGRNSANPHGVAGETALAEGDPLLFDIGVSYKSYNADMTRTFFCDHASDEHAAIYQTVLAAHLKGCEIAKPGLTCSDLDRDVTDVLRQSPYENLIVHKTGHGLGLDVHEAPQIMIGNDQSLTEGMVITIEPGLYRVDDIGVRIEDDIVITSAGSRSLNQFSKELRLIGKKA